MYTSPSGHVEKVAYAYIALMLRNFSKERLLLVGIGGIPSRYFCWSRVTMPDVAEKSIPLNLTFSVLTLTRPVDGNRVATRSSSCSNAPDPTYRVSSTLEC